jgi:release factor glutamine methyltransferase
MASVRDLLKIGIETLRGVPDSDPALEARVLLRRSARLTELEILAYPERSIPLRDERRFRAALESRRTRRPLAYVIGEREFWSIPLTVSPAVLIPRPESELLVERVIEFCPQREPVILEIGTGSGCLAVALAKELSGARIYATDSSRRALRVAEANASRHGAHNITFLHGRMYGPLRGRGLEGRADAIVSNPPYLAEAEWARLAPEIRENEPRRAFVAGTTGLEVIRGLIRGAPRFLKRRGRLAVEVGCSQADEVRPFLGRRWDEVEVSLDLGGRPRVVSARLRT